MTSGRGGLMNKDEKKAAIAACKKRESVAGIYAVRCAASGEVWVGQAQDLGTIQNRVWFTLRIGKNPHDGLQKAWLDHGPDSFAFEVLERLEDEESSLIRNALLKKRMSHWQSELDAPSI
jgi:hypothetical protein